MKKAKATVSPDRKLVKINSVKELQDACDKPLYCEFGMDEDIYQIACKRLTQEIEERVRALRRVVPPYNEKRKEHDYGDPAFMARQELVNAQASSLIVYWGCPVLAAGRPGLTSTDEIHKYVRETWTANILKAVELTIMGGGMQEVIERSDFT